VLERASEALRRAQSVVVFTGAGISAESGVPTFRDALTGLWERYDPQELATQQAFHRDPDLVWGWYESRRSVVQRSKPNAGHLTVAAIEAHVSGTVLVTQNVDDLHERAGSAAPIHLHGSRFAPRCIICDAPMLPPDLPTDLPAEGQRTAPPFCACGGLARPGVVWFGESLPEDALNRAMVAAMSCDLLLTIGTSAVVYPAAEIPRVAASHGAMVVQINPEQTALDRIASVNLRGSAAAVLPELVTATWDAPS
jgi:NAD-dependent protein deacetylase/lipoamidase